MEPQNKSGGVEYSKMKSPSLLESLNWFPFLGGAEVQKNSAAPLGE
jgi:hypothetical protein